MVVVYSSKQVAASRLSAVRFLQLSDATQLFLNLVEIVSLFAFFPEQHFLELVSLIRRYPKFLNTLLDHASALLHSLETTQ